MSLHTIVWPVSRSCTNRLLQLIWVTIFNPKPSILKALHNSLSKIANVGISFVTISDEYGCEPLTFFFCNDREVEGELSSEGDVSVYMYRERTT